MPLVTLDVRRWRRALAAAVLPLACALLAACGSDTPPSAGGNAPTDAGLLHVVLDGSILSYRIEGSSGRLELTGTQAVAAVGTIAVEPQGRLLFAGVATDQDGNGGGLASFAIDRRSGTLSHVADVAAPDCVMTWWDSSPKCEWLWLEAGETRVVSMWVNKTYHDFYFDYVSYGFDSGGRLGNPLVQDFGEWDPGHATADAVAGLFYKAGAEETSNGAGDPSTLVAYAIRGDGSLERKRSTRTCGTVTFPEWSWSPSPIVAGGGFLFTNGVISGQNVVCSHRGSELESRDSYPFDARAAAFLPAAGNQPALLALVAPPETQSEVRVLAITSDGRFQPHFSFPLAASPVAGETLSELLFHPSGDYLFALGTRGSVFTYAVDAGGGRLVWTEAGASTAVTAGHYWSHGRMAVTP